MSIPPRSGLHTNTLGRNLHLPTVPREFVCMLKWEAHPSNLAVALKGRFFFLKKKGELVLLDPNVYPGSDGGGSIV